MSTLEVIKTGPFYLLKSRRLQYYKLYFAGYVSFLLTSFNFSQLGMYLTLVCMNFSSLPNPLGKTLFTKYLHAFGSLKVSSAPGHCPVVSLFPTGHLRIADSLWLGNLLDVLALVGLIHGMRHEKWGTCSWCKEWPFFPVPLLEGCCSAGMTFLVEYIRIKCLLTIFLTD